MHKNNVSAGLFMALSAPEQRYAVVNARETLIMIADAPGEQAIKRIDKMIGTTAPRLPAFLSVLEKRKIGEVLGSLPVDTGAALRKPVPSEAIRLGASFLGETNGLVKDARACAAKRAHIANVERGAGVLADGTAGLSDPGSRIPDPGSRSRSRVNFKMVQKIAGPKREALDKQTKHKDRILHEKVWERIRLFDKGAKTAFKELEPGPHKVDISEDIIVFTRISALSRRGALILGVARIFVDYANLPAQQ